jgi:uncharacterized protein
LPSQDLIRFVMGPDKSMVPDLAEKLPGRGVWITATRAAVTAAVAKNAFAKSFKKPVSADKALPDLIEKLMRERLKQAFSFANKAGQVVTGFAKVEAAVEANAVVALVQANDAAEDGVDRLARKFTAIRTAVGKPAPLSRFLNCADLSLAMGRSNVVHAALTGGGQCKAFLYEGQRLHRYLQDDLTIDWTSDMASKAVIGTSTEQA